MDKPADTDYAQRFLFDSADIRGETVQLSDAYRDTLEAHQYPPAVGRLLGEFLAAAVLLSSTLKFDGKLVLQVRSEGQVPLLMVECSSERQVRAIARGAGEATSDEFDVLLAGGQLAITIQPNRGQRYQGIVPLVGGTLGSSLEAYFEQSEQLHTRFWLACDGERAAGVLLQQLPVRLQEDPDLRQQQWEHACTLAQTIRPDEMLTLAPGELIHRVYHEDPVRLFDPGRVMFHCSCSRERTLGALASIGKDEIEDLLEEMGSIIMDCEFCNQRYQYQREDLAEVLGEDDDQTLH